MMRWLLLLLLPLPALAHGIDQAAGEVLIGEKGVQISLTIPTTLLGFADTDRNGEIDRGELERHRAELLAALQSGLELETGAGQATVKLAVPDALPASLSPARSGNRRTHSTLLLDYSYASPLSVCTLRYNLFVSGFPNATCLVSYLRGKISRTAVLTPGDRELVVAK
jgi:hypothetical protein